MLLHKPYPSTLKGFFGRARSHMLQFVNTNVEVIEETNERYVLRGYGDNGKTYEFVRFLDEDGQTHYYCDDVTEAWNKFKCDEFYAIRAVIAKFNSIYKN